MHRTIASLTGIALLTTAALLALGLVLPKWLLFMCTMAFANGLVSLGIVLLMRGGVVAFGQGLMSAIGGYTAALMFQKLGVNDALVLTMCGGITSLLITAPFAPLLSRYRGIFFGMLNLAVSMVIFALIGKLYNLTGGSDGIRIERPLFLGIATDRDTFEIILLVLSITLALTLGWLTQRFMKSGYGEALLGLKTNETRLEYLGLSAHNILWIAYIFSALLMGVSGAIFALTQGLVTPDIGSWLRSGEYVFIMILGGTSNALGAFLGAGVFELVKLTASAYMSGVWQMLLDQTCQ